MSLCTISCKVLRVKIVTKIVEFHVVVSSDLTINAKTIFLTALSTSLAYPVTLL